MSFSLGVFELFSFILPGLIYLYTFNEFFKLLGLQHINYADLTGITAMFGIGAAAYLMGFFFHSLLLKIWFADHGSEPEKVENFTLQTKDKLSIEFTFWDIDLLYSVLVVREGEVFRNHVDKLKAYNMMFRNLVGISIVLVAQQITIMIINGYAVVNLLLILLFLLIGIFSYERQEYFLVAVCTNTILHAYAYGHNLEAFISNDQPRWDYSQIHQSINQEQT